jgi:hypothetical protein
MPNSACKAVFRVSLPTINVSPIDTGDLDQVFLPQGIEL